MPPSRSGKPCVKPSSGITGERIRRIAIAALLACYCRSMIPYDDLVVALAGWRTRQGLPVVQVAGAAPAPARHPGPPAGPRTAPPNAPPRSAPQAPIAADDFGADALIEDATYDVAGEDYV